MVARLFWGSPARVALSDYIDPSEVNSIGDRIWARPRRSVYSGIGYIGFDDDSSVLNVPPMVSDSLVRPKLRSW